MSSNNYSDNLRNENQGYTFNGVPAFFPQCSAEEQLPSAYATNTIINVGLSGPGTHLEETTSAVPPVVKPSGRGRRKNRKKISRIEDLNDSLGIEPVEDVDAALNEDIPMPRIPDTVQGDPMYGAQNPDIIIGHDNQLLLNSNTLDQILSYKKMLLLQSPEVVEFLAKHQPKHQPNNKKRSQQ